MIQNENQYPNAVKASTKTGCHDDILKFSFPQRYAEAYINVMEHFLDVLQGTTFNSREHFSNIGNTYNL